MAKKFMTSTWSWDHCFNALAMADLGDRTMAKQIALHQFSAPFYLQTEQGVLPDMWNPDVETRWGTTKPPIHGWCFGKLMDRFDFTEEELKTVYGWLEKWTGWWMEYSDTDHDGIPDYPQGCDSGWDNSTRTADSSANSAGTVRQADLPVNPLPASSVLCFLSPERNTARL